MGSAGGEHVPPPAPAPPTYKLDLIPVLSAQFFPLALVALAGPQCLDYDYHYFHHYLLSAVAPVALWVLLAQVFPLPLVA